MLHEGQHLYSKSVSGFLGNYQRRNGHQSIELDFCGVLWSYSCGRFTDSRHALEAMQHHAQLQLTSADHAAGAADIDRVT